MEIKTRIDLVKILPKDALVIECGVAEGNFSRDLLVAGVGLLWSIDNWATIEGVTGDGNHPQKWHDKNFESAKEKLIPFGERSRIYRALTGVACNYFLDEQVDMVYFDAAHFYDGIMADLRDYYPIVKSGGIVAGHDFLNMDYGVNKAVKDFIRQNKINTTLYTISENHPNDASFYFIKP